MEKIEAEGYNLNISRYISTAVQEEDIDLNAVHQELAKAEKKSAEALKAHNQFLKELGLPLLPQEIFTCKNVTHRLPLWY